MAGLIDFSQKSFYISAASIIFNPLMWNIVARQEYHHKIITRLFGGNSRLGCYALAATIFSLGIVRDVIYHNALSDQPKSSFMTESPLSTPLSYGLFLTGNVLVITSMWTLGITGTYLGDYFGILMDYRVTSFPFNVTDAPMYWGSVCSFLATAVYYGKPAGVALSFIVYLVYKVALSFEDPFTAEIYAKRDREQKKGKGKKAA